MRTPFRILYLPVFSILRGAFRGTGRNLFLGGGDIESVSGATGRLSCVSSPTERAPDPQIRTLSPKRKCDKVLA